MSPTTVTAIRPEASSSLDNAPATVTTSDGRQYPARRQTEPPQPKEQQAKERQGTRTDINIPERFPEASTGEAREHAAAAVKVNPRYVSDAGQARGEIASRETYHGNQWSVTEPDTPPATLSDLGITRQRLHEAGGLLCSRAQTPSRAILARLTRF